MMETDIFQSKSLTPMLIGQLMNTAFDDPEYLYELKWDGVRCLAYLEEDGAVELRNKRNLRVNALYPELMQIQKQIKGQKRCILDGELVVLKDGKPKFFEIQRRALMTDKTKIQLLASRHPVSFVVFDILYYDAEVLTNKPLVERKEILRNVVTDSERMAVSKVINGIGTSLYDFTLQHELEGIVAKQRSSKYWPGKRSKEWIKIKRMAEEDYVICGYIKKAGGLSSLVLGQYQGDKLLYKGHVTMGLSRDVLRRIEELPKVSCPFESVPDGNEGAVWVELQLVCSVEYMPRDEVRSQPVFKGLRNDKTPKECIS